ncbi:MAG: hypothetical protein QME58_10990 [Bacteroidota bacterium]|nr:hypothetical protein [Bacteroidota bacterium]
MYYKFLLSFITLLILLHTQLSLVFSQSSQAQFSQSPLDELTFSRNLLPCCAKLYDQTFDTTIIMVKPGWNLISLPISPGILIADSLFPNAISKAYAYMKGYVVADTLELGVGYWLKFDAPDTIAIIQYPAYSVVSTVKLSQGWNMIGTTNLKVLTDTITTDPGGIVVAGYYEYVTGVGYIKADTILPGKGYWVKASSSGKLILRCVESVLDTVMFPFYFDEPAWHPGGEWIAAYHAESLDTNGDGVLDYGFAGIWLVHAVTGERQPLIEGYELPAWSPDGTQLAIERGGQIYKVTVTSLNPAQYDISSLTQLTFAGRNFYPTWSPDAQWIAYDSNFDSPNGMYFIWKMQSDGSHKRRIAYEPQIGEIRQPSWSPNGEKIIHYRYPGDTTFSSEIYTMDSSGLNPVRLTYNNARDRSPKYSPDGTKIGFYSKPRIGPPALWTMDANGTNLQKISPDYAGRFDWSPDGIKFVFLYYDFLCPRSGNGQLWLINTDGTGLRQLTYYYRP